MKKLDPSTSLVENAARIVAVRLDEMRSFAARALEPGDADAQHDMRIAAKRLRYILETTGFCLGRPAKIAARRARELQEVLGGLHDCDVMLPMIEAQLGELRAADAEAIRERAGTARDLEPALAARAPHRTAYRGLEMLTVYVQARRGLLFERFCEMWSEQERAATWGQLESVVMRRLNEARESRRSAERVERARRKLEEAELIEQTAAERARRAAAELEVARRDDSSQSAVWLPANGREKVAKARAVARAARRAAG